MSRTLTAFDKMREQAAADFIKVLSLYEQSRRLKQQQQDAKVAGAARAICEMEDEDARD